MKRALLALALATVAACGASAKSKCRAAAEHTMSLMSSSLGSADTAGLDGKLDESIKKCEASPPPGPVLDCMIDAKDRMALEKCDDLKVGPLPPPP